MNILRKENFLTPSVCEQLNDWVVTGVENKWLDCGLVDGMGWVSETRKTTRVYADRFEYPQVVYDVSNAITSFLGLEHLEKSVVGGGRGGVVVSCTFPGGNVHKHTDPVEDFLPRTHVLRCNILTQKADDGGDLFINNTKVNLSVGELHCYLASTVEHWVSTVKGETPRILWMFGYRCTAKEFDQIRSNYCG